MQTDNETVQTPWIKPIPIKARLRRPEPIALDAVTDASPRLRRLTLVTDAWKSQTNGIVNTLICLVKHLENHGVAV